jgi:hypothetical protein
MCGPFSATLTVAQGSEVVSKPTVPNGVPVKLLMESTKVLSKCYSARRPVVLLNDPGYFLHFVESI